MADALARLPGTGAKMVNGGPGAHSRDAIFRPARVAK